MGINLDRYMEEAFIDADSLPRRIASAAGCIKPEQIFASFSDLPEGKNVVFIDAYGVFWDGSQLIPGALEEMGRMMEQHRTVVVMSNATQLSSDARASYQRRGLEAGIHYNNFITSGDIFREALLRGEIGGRIGEANPTLPEGKIKIYVHGKPNVALFEGYDGVEIVGGFEEADAVYMSIPQYTFGEIQALYPDCGLSLDAAGDIQGLAGPVGDYFKKSNLTKPGEPDGWGSVSIDPFVPFLDRCAEKGLPLLNANPDTKAAEREKGTDPIVINHVIRNGALTRFYRDMGGQVIEYGKPGPEIYEYTMKVVGLEPADRGRIIMIGDTEKTDIAGARASEIDSALTVGTGNAGRKLGKRETDHGVVEKLERIRATNFVLNMQGRS